jgi:hypothetical protein
MGRVATSQQQARAGARRRLIAAQHDRANRDKRVQAGQGRAGEALRAIIADAIMVVRVAQPCDPAVGQVHRRRRASKGERDPGVNTDPAGPDPVTA